MLGRLLLPTNSAAAAQVRLGGLHLNSPGSLCNKLMCCSIGHVYADAWTAFTVNRQRSCSSGMAQRAAVDFFWEPMQRPDALLHETCTLMLERLLLPTNSAAVAQV